MEEMLIKQPSETIDTFVRRVQLRLRKVLEKQRQYTTGGKTMVTIRVTEG